MTFVDPLSVMLLVAGMSTLLLAIYALMSVRSKKGLANLAVPMFAFGLFNFISGFLMSFAWPMPGAYNILFGDAQLVLGLLMLMGGYMVYKNMDLKILTVFGFFFGIYLAVVSMMAPNRDGVFYNELLARSGLTAKTLSAVLKDLARAGLVEREVIAASPVRVRYALTSAGAKLIGSGCPLVELAAAQRRGRS